MKQYCPRIHTIHQERDPGIRSSCRMHCAAEIRPDLYKAGCLGVRKILSWLRENPCTEISFAKASSRCGAPTSAGAPTAGTATRENQGSAEGSGESVHSKRTAFPPHPPLFLSVMGKNLGMTSGAAMYLLGACTCQRFSKQGSRQLPLCITRSPVTESLLIQLLAGVSPGAGC